MGGKDELRETWTDFQPASEHGNDAVHLHILGAGRNDELRDPALIDRLDFHRRLVRLDLGDDVAGANLVAFLDEPFRQRALFHRRGKGGHQDIRRHGQAPTAV